MKLRASTKLSVEKLRFCIVQFPNHPALEGWQKFFDNTTGNFRSEYTDQLARMLEKFEFDISRNDTVIQVIHKKDGMWQVGSFVKPEDIRKKKIEESELQGNKYREMSKSYAEHTKLD